MPHFLKHKLNPGGRHFWLGPAEGGKLAFKAGLLRFQHRQAGRYSFRKVSFLHGGEDVIDTARGILQLGLHGQHFFLVGVIRCRQGLDLLGNGTDNGRLEHVVQRGRVNLLFKRSLADVLFGAGTLVLMSRTGVIGMHGTALAGAADADERRTADGAVGNAGQREAARAVELVTAVGVLRDALLDGVEQIARDDGRDRVLGADALGLIDADVFLIAEQDAQAVFVKFMAAGRANAFGV